MYSFVTHTWNPLGGQCPHACSYCYVKRMKAPGTVKKYNGEPRLIEKELVSLGESKVIFVCTMSDLFALGVPGEIVSRILGHCVKYPENSYLFQTKNPGRMMTFESEFPATSIVCTTMESDSASPSVAPPPLDRVRSLIELKKLRPDLTYSITIEPIMQFHLETLVKGIKELSPRFVSIGADSGGNDLPEPSADEINALIKELLTFTQVVIKDNLRRITHA